MIRYLARRLMHAAVVIFVVMVASFVLLHMLPGGPVRASLPVTATPLQVAQMTHEYGYDKPLYAQFGTWLWHLIHGDLGFSVQLNLPVGQAIMQHLPKTILLMGMGTAASLLIGIPLGVYQATHRYKIGDYVLTSIAFLGYAAPPFFVGLLLIEWLAVDTHVFPAAAPQGDTVNQILAQPNALVLPVATYAIGGFAHWARFMRSAAMDNLVQDYVRTARATGAGEARVLWGHVLRNSLIPIVTLLGLQLPMIFAGAVIIETLFNYPGMGLLFWQAAQSHDYPILIGTVLVGTVLTVIGNLIADLGYAALDPRVRFATAGA